MGGVGKFYIHVVHPPSYRSPFICNKPRPRRGPGPRNRMGPVTNGSCTISRTIKLAKALHSRSIYLYPQRGIGRPDSVSMRQELSSEQHGCGEPLTTLERDPGAPRLSPFLVSVATVRGLKSGMPAFYWNLSARKYLNINYLYEEQRHLLFVFLK